MPVDTVISQDLLDDTDEDLDEDDVDDVRRLRAAQAAIQVGRAGTLVCCSMYRLDKGQQLYYSLEK